MAETTQPIQLPLIASSVENTPELRSYWQKRYSDLIQQDLFRLSDKTFELVSSTNQIDKPATPFGDLILTKHINQSGALDEILLQNSIETAIRLLDALLDKIPFTPEAAHITSQYRKIGLGILDFKEYISKISGSSQLDQIDYLGSLISGSAYRASESLAEEKGTCKNWDKIKKHVRPKSFEYWYHTETGDIKNGLEISEDFDQEQIIQSSFELVPRRNSNILLFPPDLEWQIWGDRDSSSPKTEIVPPQVQATPQPITEPKPAQPESPQPVEVAAVVAPVLPADQNTNSETSSENLPKQPEEIQPSQTEAQTQTFDSLPVTEESLEESTQMAEETDAPLLLENDSLENDTVSEPELEGSQTLSEEMQMLAVEESSELNAMYQLGELVRVENPELEEYGKVYQVIDIASVDSGVGYRLTDGQHDLENVVEEKDLQPVELSSILEKINLATQEQSHEGNTVPEVVPAPAVDIENEIQHRLDQEMAKIQENHQRDLQQLRDSHQAATEQKELDLEPKIAEMKDEITKEYEQKITQIQAEHNQEKSELLTTIENLKTELASANSEEVIQARISQEVEKRVAEQMQGSSIQSQIQKQVEANLGQALEKKIVQKTIEKLKIMSKYQG